MTFELKILIIYKLGIKYNKFKTFINNLLPISPKINY